MILGLALAALVVIVLAVTWSRFAADVRAHRARVRRGSRIVPSPFGSIEVATAGDGPAVLISHGFAPIDTRRLLEAGFGVIAPSRFGYLRSASPSDPSPENQADAFAALLDELRVDRVSVLGVSTGALAALQFAVRHPQRCRSLVVVVPLVRLREQERLTPLRSDLLYWLAMKLARDAMIRRVLGTEPFVVEAASPVERRRADDLLWSVLPIGERTQGFVNDRRSLERPSPIALGIEVPTLVVSTKDDLHGTFEAARVIAASIPCARLVMYRTGGHVLIGRGQQLFDEMLAFFRE